MANDAVLTPRSAAYRIFWLGRYIERAEDNARMLDTLFYSAIDSGRGFDDLKREWEGVLKSLGIWEAYLRTGGSLESRAVVEYIISAESNPSSLLRCIEQARENANGAAPDEIYVELNKLFHRVKGTSLEDLWRMGLHDFIRDVIRSIHTIGGMIDRLWA